MTPEEQLEGISDVCQKLVARQYRYLKVLLQELESEGLYFIHPDEASPEQKDGWKNISNARYSR